MRERRGRGKFWVMLLIMLWGLPGCGIGVMTLELPYQANPPGPETLVTTAAKRIKVGSFSDKRSPQVEPILIGRRTAAWEVPMGDVYLVHPVFDVVRNAVTAELAAAGHQLVQDNAEVTVRGDILQFWVHTETTMLYWDVISEVAFDLGVSSERSPTAEHLGPYKARKEERTYTHPTAEMLSRLLTAALTECLQQRTIFALP